MDYYIMGDSRIDTIAASGIIMAEAEMTAQPQTGGRTMNVDAVLASMIEEETSDIVIIDETSDEPTVEEIMGAEDPYNFVMDYLDRVQKQRGDIIAGRQARYIIINFIEAATG